MEPIDIVIIVVLSIAVIGIVAYLIKKKMKGESGCGCGCSGCPHANACASAKPVEKMEEPVNENNDAAEREENA